MSLATERLLCQAFLQSHPRDGALILERLPLEEAAALLEKTSPEVAAMILQGMAPDTASGCLARLAPEKATPVLFALPVEVAAGVLRRLETAAQDRILMHAPAEFSLPVRRLLAYPEGTAGALMDPRALALPDDVTSGEALTRVRRSPRNVLYYLYIVDRDQRLVGVLNLRELMLAPTKTMLSSAMQRNVARLPALADLNSILAHPSWRDFHALPVVDASDTFLGVIRYETLRRLEYAAGAQPDNPAVTTVLSLGELCWIGFAGMLAGLAAAVSPRVGTEDKESDDGSKR